MTVAKPQDFKLTRFYVDTDEESIAVQKAMFKMGFRWIHSESGAVRTALYRPKCWLIVDDECRIYWTAGHMEFKVNGKETKAATQEALFAAAEAFHKQKTLKRKDSRMRARLRKEGWTINTGVQPEGELTALKFRDGEVRTRTPYPLGSSSFDIPYEYNPDKTVVAYKLVEAKKPVETVSFGEMVKDIVESSKLPEGYIPFTPTKTSVAPVGADDVVDLILRGGAKSHSMKVKYCDWGTLSSHPGQEIIGYRLARATTTDVATKAAPLVETETNPKKQFGDKSIPLNLWPALASSYGALGLYNGKLKYGQSNFNATPVEASIYIAGAKRHLEAWAEGEEFDPADGVPNLGGVLANIAILLEARAAGTLIDDRKLGSGYLKERDELKKIVASLQVLHADKSPRHYTLKDAK